MMRSIRQHKILTAVVAVLLVLVLAILLIVLFAEPFIKSFLERKGSSTLGRELVIEGPFHIDWHWGYTKVHAERIRLSNAPGYPDPNMASIETLDLSFNPLRLLRGDLEFGDVILNKPFLVLDKKSATDFNWNFPVFSQANMAAETLKASDRHEFPVFKTLQLKAGHFIYRDAVKAMNLDLALDSVSGQGGNADAKKANARQFTMQGTGSMHNQKFVLEAGGGSLDELRDSNKSYPLYVKLVMGPTQILVDGTFKDPIALSGIDASLKVSGHNMADLFYLTAIPLPPTPPYHLEGRLTKAGGTWGYENFKGMVGGSDLAGSLAYNTSYERGFLKANLVSKLMDSRDLGGFIGLSPSNENAAPEQKQAAAEKKASPKLIPDVPLKLERLRTTDLDVSLSAEKIVAPNLPFKGMQVRFDLRNGYLKLDPLNVVLADGTLDGRIEIDANKDVPPMKMNLNLHKLSLGQFFNNTRFAKTTEGFFGGKVNLEGKGVSLADVLATSNGDITIIMSGGKISLLLVEASDLDIAQAVPLFLGKDKATKIRCGVTDFGVKNGLVSSKVVVLDTNDSVLVGSVVIDLKREIISAKLDAKPKDSSLFSVQAPIVLNGQLKSPSIGIDARKATGKGATAALLGSLLTPLAAIIPFIERGGAEDADCRALLAAARK